MIGILKLAWMLSKINEIQKLVNKVPRKIVNIQSCSVADCGSP